eukprot:scaffold8013_cov124-Isochrysis_galbana.AAC.1
MHDQLSMQGLKGRKATAGEQVSQRGLGTLRPRRHRQRRSDAQVQPEIGLQDCCRVDGCDGQRKARGRRGRAARGQEGKEVVQAHYPGASEIARGSEQRTCRPPRPRRPRATAHAAELHAGWHHTAPLPPHAGAQRWLVVPPLPSARRRPPDAATRQRGERAPDSRVPRVKPPCLLCQCRPTRRRLPAPKLCRAPVKTEPLNDPTGH